MKVVIRDLLLTTVENRVDAVLDRVDVDHVYCICCLLQRLVACPKDAIFPVTKYISPSQ